MRKIIVLEFLTLDGVMQAPGGSKEDLAEGSQYGGWTAPFFDDEAGAEMGKQMAGEYDLLLGRKTYDIFAGYWPTNTETWPQVNKITKYAVSSTLTNPTWENTEIIRNTKGLQDLKNSNGADLQVYGSGNLVQTLLKYDLVDELWLKIFPITLGTGKKLFMEGTKPASFALIHSKVTKNGVIFASYKRTGEVKTGEVG